MLGEDGDQVVQDELDRVEIGDALILEPPPEVAAVGIAIMRPSMLKAAALSQAAAAAAPEDRAAKLAAAAALRQRGAGSAKFVAVLLIIAVAAMAVARYV